LLAGASNWTSVTQKLRYAADLRNPALTIEGGSQHIVQWQADTPTGVATVFTMMQLYDLPALPSCTVVREAREHAIGCD
jgi:hypothetical protein